MLVVALTGGIAAGKSTIGAQLARLGAHRIDADQLAREAVAPGSPGLQAIIARFGTSILTDDGALNRAALGEIVFVDPVALRDLNGIVHPEVRRLYDEAVGRSQADVVVYEVPLLAESGPEDLKRWDYVITAEAPVEIRVKRMRELRGMTEGAARDRIANQASEADRREIADYVVETGGTPERTREQVELLWRELKELARVKLSLD